MQIGKFVIELRSARLQKGMSQAELAMRIGTTQSAIARLEAGQSEPRLSTIQRYAEAVSARLVLLEQAESPSLAVTASYIQQALTRETSEVALRHVIQFLDDIGQLDPQGRLSSISAEPASTGDIRWDAMLAGVAEHVAFHAGTPVPGWASAPGRFLNRFWFVIEDILGRPARGLAALAFAKSPPSFANRGVFLDGASLVSV